MAGNGGIASRVISAPAFSSLYAPHRILLEPKGTGPRWLAVLALLPEDRPVRFWLLG